MNKNIINRSSGNNGKGRGVVGGSRSGKESTP